MAGRAVVLAGEDATPDRAARETAELVGSRRELADALTRQVDFLVAQLKRTPEEAVAEVRRPSSFDPLEHGPEQASWHDLARLAEGDPDAAQALWATLKAEARAELGTGLRAARTLERRLGGGPWERARYLALLEELDASLQPRDGLERLLAQQMASALEQQLRWQERAAQRVEEEAWQGERDRRRAWERLAPAQRERVGELDGWLPERLADAESVELAGRMADRYQRMFLRLAKALRDQRRLVGTLVVTGGQVNVGERQVNVARDP